MPAPPFKLFERPQTRQAQFLQNGWLLGTNIVRQKTSARSFWDESGGIAREHGGGCMCFKANLAAAESAAYELWQIRVAASESGENECRWFRGMGTVLASVADREMIERGIHDLYSFVRMSAAD